VALDGGVSMQLTQTANGYTLRLGSGAVEHYNTGGQLTDYTESGRTYTITVTITDRAGLSTVKAITIVAVEHNQ
jgi:hypothetical protein